MPHEKSAKLKLPKARYNFSVWIFCGVGMLLFGLAGLQYRWIAEVSQAEQERLKENLQLAMNRFARDFESEFFHPIIMGKPAEWPGTNQPDFDVTASARAARQYDQWIASARYPGLLQDLFVTRIPAAGRVDLFRFDPASRKLVYSDWPQELLRFRDFCIAESMQSKRMYQEHEIPDPEDVPAMIFPFSLPFPPKVGLTVNRLHEYFDLRNGKSFESIQDHSSGSFLIWSNKIFRGTETLITTF